MIEDDLKALATMTLASFKPAFLADAKPPFCLLIIFIRVSFLEYSFKIFSELSSLPSFTQIICKSL